MNPFAAVFDIVPGWIWAAVCAGMLSWGGVNAYRVGAVKTEIAELKADYAVAESAGLREAKKEISRLVTETNNLNEAYREQSSTIDRLERTARDAGVRVTKAQRDAAIAAGSAEAVSHYASVAGDVYQACRDEYRAMGYDAARGSAAAHALKQWVDLYPPAKEFDEKLKTFTNTLKGKP